MNPEELAQMLNGKSAHRLRAESWDRAIRRRSYKVADTDCLIWLGNYAKRLGQKCTFPDADNRTVDVKMFLTGTPYIRGEFPIWGSTCGNGRCINPDHVVLAGRRGPIGGGK